MSSRFARAFGAVWSLVPALAVLASLASVGTAEAQMVVTSGADWKMLSTLPPAGWNTQVAFDDSLWPNAIVNAPNNPIGSHTADHLWDSPLPASGSSTVYFRKVFTTPGPAVAAIMEAAADDDLDLWINGTLVLSSSDCLAAYHPGIDVRPYLVPGQNLVATVARDCGLFRTFGFYLGIASSPGGAGSLDTFDAGIVDNAGLLEVSAIAIQPDGKILVGGNFTDAGVGCGTTPCPAARTHLLRLNQDGSLDLSFSPGYAFGRTVAIAVQPDGKILAAGLAGFKRLNADGSVDQSFDAGHLTDVRAIAVQPDGRILIGGLFTSVGAPSAVLRQNLARLEADGSVDPSFDPGANGRVHAISPQADGTIYVGGEFTMLGGGGSGATARSLIGLLAGDGSLLPFAPTVAGSYVKSVVRQPDGRVLIGGFFMQVNGATRQGYSRVFADGSLDSLDPMFSAGAGTGWDLVTALQADGRIVVAGVFTSAGATARPSLVRLLPDGAVDTSYTPSGLVSVTTNRAVALDAEGRTLVGGDFRKLAGSARNYLARLLNATEATSAVAPSGGGAIVTWTRGGSSAEVDWVTFESTLDGEIWTMLGTGTRIAGGWQITGQSVPSSAVVRARGYSGGSILESVYLPQSVNFIRNPSFTNGTANWLQFATPDSSYMPSAVNAGVFEFFRAAPPAGTTNQAVVLQDTGLPVPKGAPLAAQFQLGNSDSTWKRVTVVLHDRTFGDLSVCLFWLAPQSPLRTYGLTARPTQSLARATLSFYAATIGSAGGWYRLDNVSLQYVPTAPAGRTVCTDPTAPAPVSGPAGPELLVNGDFGSGTFAPGWFTFGQITAQVSTGVAEFVKNPGSPGGVIGQATNQPIPAGSVLAVNIYLGNSSPVRKRVLILAHDADFSDLGGCTFWIPGGLPLSPFSLRLFTREAWSNATLSVYPSTVGPDAWIRADNVSLRTLPIAGSVGADCAEPVGTPDPPDDAHSGSGRR